MQDEVLSKLHGVLQEILDDFAQICEANNLPYFLMGGTLIGAVRHKGFIPWDDDLDVGMLRSDYEKFIEIFNSIENSKYYLVHMNDHYLFSWLKVCKKNTLFSEKKYDQSISQEGIFIDIWIFDNSCMFLLPLQETLIKLARRIYLSKTNVFNSKNWYKRYPVKILSVFVPKKFCIWFTKKLPRFFNKFNTAYITNFASHTLKEDTYSKKSMFPLTKLLFEDRYYYVPGDYINFLETCYDNYLELPPIEKRVGHMPEYVVFDTTTME